MAVERLKSCDNIVALSHVVFATLPVAQKLRPSQPRSHHDE
jgi:hypothetical protein